MSIHILELIPYLQITCNKDISFSSILKTIKIMKKLRIVLTALLIVSISANAQEQSVEAEKSTEPVRLLITGSLSPEGMETIGKPISVISKEELDRKSEGSIADTLSKEPGVSSTNFGPGASRPLIRGQGKERVRVLENGMESGDVSSVSDDHAVPLDTLGTERVDILRGPSTLLFGSQAIGGVVNIIDGSIKEEAIGKDLTGKIELSGGDSASEQKAGALMLEGQKGSLNWHFSGYSRETGDISIPGFAESSIFREQEAAEETGHDHDIELEEDHDHAHNQDLHSDEAETEQKGTLKNSDTDSYGVKGGLTHVWDRGFFGIAVRHTGSEYGIPGGHSHAEEDSHEHSLDEEAEEVHADETVRIDLEQTKIESRGAVHLHDGFMDSVKFGLIYSDYTHDELEGSEVGTTYDRKAFEGRALITHHHEDLLEGGFGIQLNHEDLSVTGAEAFIPDAETFSPGIFTIEDFALNDNLIWQVGGRIEHAAINPSGLDDKDFNPMSASTGLIWHDQDKKYSTAFTASYSERAPNVSELFADGVHVASQIYERGSSDLETENSVSMELIFRKLTGTVRGSFGTFVQDYSNYINLQNSGEEIDSFDVYDYSEIEARLWGFETEVEADLYNHGGHLLTLYSGFDLVRGRNKTNDDNLPRVTPVRTKLGMEYSYNKLSSFVEAVIAESQDNTAEYELPTDGYTLLNAGFDYTIAQGQNSKVKLFTKGTNLTDEEARIHSSFLKDLAPLRGRAFFAGIRAEF